MKSDRAIILINLLGKHCHGNDNILRELYNEAVASDARYQELNNTLESCVFGCSSKSILEEAEECIARLQNEPACALAQLSKADRINTLIKQNQKTTISKLVSSTQSSEPALLLRKEEYSIWKDTLDLLMSVCLFEIARYRGIKGLNSTVDIAKPEVQDLFVIVNNILLPQIKNITLQEKRRWVIWRKPAPKSILLSGPLYYTEYYSDDSSLSAVFENKGSPLGTTAFYNTDAFATINSPTPCCWGRGKIMSVLPQRGKELLGRQIVDQLRPPQAHEYSLPLTSAKECINSLTNNNNYCINPEDLAKNMDYWESSFEITARKKGGACLLCGRSCSNGASCCNVHFGVLA